MPLDVSEIYEWVLFTVDLLQFNGVHGINCE